MNKLGKSERVLAILYKVMQGESIQAKKIAEKYEVSVKSIHRDISSIRIFLAEYGSMNGDTGAVELKYDRQNHTYSLTRQDILQAKDLLVILKILLGVRTLDKESLNLLVHRAISYRTSEQKQFFRNIYKDKLDSYHSIIEEPYEDIINQIWILERLIREGKTFSVVYHRLDGKCVECSLYPIATIFSDHYFYLLACRADKEGRAVVYYRVDRIEKITVLVGRNPIDIEERRRLEASSIYNQNMFMGERMRIRFVYSGPSLQAILDKFPTAEIVKQTETETELTALVEYSRGTIMELLRQGNWLRVLGPEKLVEDMEVEIDELKKLYAIP